jgi:hypothetical protein
MRHVLILLVSLLLVSSASVLGSSPPAEKPVGVVSHVKVLSDKVPDVSSLEAWKKSFIKEGMSDQDKALAIWRTVFTFRHQDQPPNELLQNEQNVHDPIKTFNVYGYGMCCCASSNIEALARYVGLDARGWAITLHSVPEVFYEGNWHMFDASLIGYFPKPDGKIAGVEEIVAGVKDWYEKNPDYKGNDKKLSQFMVNGGWKKGPEILANAPTYDNNGWWPAATHGWYSTMVEFSGKTLFQYEYGYSQGYHVNVQLRPGEVLTRNWSNKGLHVNMADGKGGPGCLKDKVGKQDMRYSPKYGDLAPGRIGNGTLEYNAALDPGLARNALRFENLKLGQNPFLTLADGAKPGILEIRMPSSYVYLTGKLSVGTSYGSVAVQFSDNNGLDWKDVGKIERGTEDIDISKLVFRRYDYRLRITLIGDGADLCALALFHDIQHSQRALPALAQGKNTITFSAGPQEGTITVEGSTNPEAKGKQLLYTDFHPTSEGLEGSAIRVGSTGNGSITFPIATPAEMVRLRFGCHYRARDAKDGWDMQVSFDGGKTFKTVDRAAGPFKGNCKYVTVSDIPAGTKEAVVKFSGQQRNTTCIFDFRIDADYREPSGGFAPVKITYVWDEGGQEKRDVHVARKPDETYTIECAAKPTMKSLVVERAK